MLYKTNIVIISCIYRCQPKYSTIRNNVYISRACGYKTLFNLNSLSGIVQTEPLTPDGTWIKNIVVVKPNLETENEVHVQIYF